MGLPFFSPSQARRTPLWSRTIRLLTCRFPGGRMSIKIWRPRITASNPKSAPRKNPRPRFLRSNSSRRSITAASTGAGCASDCTAADAGSASVPLPEAPAVAAAATGSEAFGETEAAGTGSGARPLAGTALGAAASPATLKLISPFLSLSSRKASPSWLIPSQAQALPSLLLRIRPAEPSAAALIFPRLLPASSRRTILSASMTLPES